MRIGNCKGVLIRISDIRIINLHRHTSGWSPRKPMMQSYYSIDLLKDTVAKAVAVPDYRTYESKMSKLKLLSDIWYRAGVA